MRVNVVASGILFSKSFTFVFSVLNFVYLTISLSTTSLIFSGLQEQFLIYQHLNHLLLFFKLFKLVGTLTNLSISNWSTSAFKAMKSF